MLKHLTGALMAITLAVSGLTATATPAAADRNDAARIIVGAAALAIIGSALADSAHGNVTVSRRYGHDDRDFRPRRLIAPAACHVRRNGGHYFGYHCMHQHVRATHLLPHRCVTTLRTHHGPRRFYGGGCLYQVGWRLR